MSLLFRHTLFCLLWTNLLFPATVSGSGPVDETELEKFVQKAEQIEPYFPLNVSRAWDLETRLIDVAISLGPWSKESVPLYQVYTVETATYGITDGAITSMTFTLDGDDDRWVCAVDPHTSRIYALYGFNELDQMNEWIETLSLDVSGREQLAEIHDFYNAIRGPEVRRSVVAHRTFLLGIAALDLFRACPREKVHRIVNRWIEEAWPTAERWMGHEGWLHTDANKGTVTNLRYSEGLLIEELSQFDTNGALIDRSASVWMRSRRTRNCSWGP